MNYNSLGRSASRPQPIGSIVDKIVSSLGLAGSYYGWQVVSCWEEIVGEHYARKSKAIRFDNGVLFVAVEDATWRNMMAMDVEKILGIIHQLPYGRVIKEIRLVRGKRGF